MPVDAVLVGAGARGFGAYGAYALSHPEDLRFVAVAEPDERRRSRFGEDHGIPPSHRFGNWEELLGQPQLASAAINATMDGDHLPSTKGLLGHGYHVLLEKPIAATPADCVRLVQAAADAGRLLQISHELRYAPFFRAVHDLVRSGRLGEMVSLDWRENLSYLHFAHSYIRGRWSNSATSTPMIVSKCTHDMDQILWIVDRVPSRIASFGSLRHFQSKHADPAIPERCTDGCPIEQDCLYYSPRQYLGSRRWGAISLADLQHGPYGRCVFRSDNDAVDHQVVIVDFQDGPAVSLTMQGASHVEGRTLRIDGLQATLVASQARNQLIVHDHGTGEAETISPTIMSGSHGGGDEGLVAAFVAATLDDHSPISTSGAESLESHLMAFAAEEARMTGRVIDMEEYRARWPVGRSGPLTSE